MADRTRTRPERRSYERIHVSPRPGLEVGLHGFDSSGKRIDTVGVAVNVSRGGLLARTDMPLHSERPCLGHFRDVGGRIIPEYAPGRVIRQGHEDDQFLVALEFSRPLAALELAGATPRP